MARCALGTRTKTEPSTAVSLLPDTPPCWTETLGRSEALDLAAGRGSVLAGHSGLALSSLGKQGLALLFRPEPGLLESFCSASYAGGSRLNILPGSGLSETWVKAE